MKMAMWLDYKPTRYEGKGFLRNLNIWIHRDITGEMWFGGWGRGVNDYFNLPTTPLPLALTPAED